MSMNLVGRKLAISVLFDVVTVEVVCGDDYEAQVLYDDLVERMKSGEGISLGIKPSEKQTEVVPEAKS